MRRLNALLTAVASLAFAAPAGAQLASTSWPQVGHDPQMTNRTSVVGTQTGTLAAGFPVNLVGHGMGYTNALRTTPAIDVDGSVLVGTSGSNYTQGQGSQPPFGQLFDIATNGSIQWIATDPNTPPLPDNGGFGYTTPAVGSDGSVYLGSPDGTLFALTPSGAINWQYYPSGAVGSPTIGPDGTLYFTVGNYDLNQNGVGKVIALNPSTQTPEWSYPIRSGAISAVALDSSGNAYVAADRLYSINSDGHTNWTAPIAQSTNAPTISGSTIFELDGGGNLRAFSRSSGRQLWVDPAIDRLGGLTAISGTALGARGTVIAPISNGVAAFSATTGKQVWSYNASAPISGPPIVDAIGDVYIATQAGDTNITGFAALNAQGQKLWTGFAPTYTQSSGPSLGNDGTLYFAEYGGALYAYTDPS